jgi:hypothetical protein
VLFLTNDGETSHVTSQTNAEVVEQQVLLYLTLPQTQEDPFDFCSQRSNNFPALSMLARRYLALPSSSVQCERLFSTFNSGDDFNDLRSSLSPESVKMLLFLKKIQICCNRIDN